MIMMKFKKGLGLIIIIAFLCQNVAYGISEKKSALRPPSHFSKSTEEFIENKEITKCFDDLAKILFLSDDNEEALAKCANSLQRTLFDSKNRSTLNENHRATLFDAMSKASRDDIRQAIANCICLTINAHLILDVTKSELDLLLDALARDTDSKETKRTIALSIGWALRFNHELLPHIIAALVNSDVAIRRYITMAFEHAVTDKAGPKLSETDIQNILDVLNKADNTNEIRQDIAAIMTFVLAHDPSLKLTDSQLKIVLNRKNRAMWTNFVVEHALYNNPVLINTAISDIVNPEPFNTVEWLVEILGRIIRQCEVGITQDTVALLTNIIGQEIKARVFNLIIEPLFFKKPNLFTMETLKAFEKTYIKDVPEFKYLLFYASMEEVASRTSLESLFPHQKRFKRLMAEGKKKVLIVHNISDGLGDELIRNSTLIQALLDSNPELEVTLYTNRPFLYDHRRVKVKNIISHEPFMHKDEFDLSGEDKFDMIVHHYDREQRYSDSFENKFQAWLAKHHSEIYIDFDKCNDKFIPKEISVQGKVVSLSGFGGSTFMVKTENVYIPIFRLCAELGLPFRYGTKKPKESLFVALPNPSAETYWENAIATANINKRPVVIFNGFGGEDIKKGYQNGKDVRSYYKTDEDDFRKMLQKLISEGFFVIILPNDKWYGMPKVADDIVNGLSTDERQYTLIAPLLSENPKLYKYLIGHSGIAMIVTIEGGIMHLSYNLGVPFLMLLMEKSGYVLQWLPAGIDSMQGYSTLQYSNRVNRRDAIEGFVVPATIKMAAFGTAIPVEKRRNVEESL